MSTPSYAGKGQPLVDSGAGWLGRFGSFFGGITPAYSGDGQPSSVDGMLGGSTPAYAQASSSRPAMEDMADQVDAEEAQASCPIDPEALAQGQIAIVIPRQQ